MPVLRVLYFASVREAVGTGEELVDAPPDVATVGALVDWLERISPAHRAALGDRARLRAAVDGRFVPLDAALGEPAEVALFPPVTGGMIRVRVQREPIDMAAELAAAELAGAGAVATFTGLVRADDGVEILELEHYPGATEHALTSLAEEAAARWGLAGATIVHRIGPMRPGERIVFVAAAAPHRAAALEACAYLIDRLKTGAPFWKKETRCGGARWVEARESDDAAAARWDQPRVSSGAAPARRSRRE